MEPNEIEPLVRARLRALRTTRGMSLDDLAARTALSPSTISRLETGKRSIGLDVLVPLAGALGVGLEELLDGAADEDVVIRPVPDRQGDRAATTAVVWRLSRPGSPIAALKMRLDPVARPPEQRVHPGHDWFFVLEGRVRLWLGDRELLVEAGEAAEFTTMTPHAFAAEGAPAEVLVLFGRDGEHAHVHT